MSNMILSLIIFVAIFSTGCAQIKPVEEKSPGSQKSTVNQVEGDFNIDVLISFEGLEIDEVRDQVETYFRVKNSIYPVPDGSLREVASLSFECQEFSGDGYTGKFARATSSEKLTSEETRELIYGNFSISPSKKPAIGFNELDRYGKGTVEMILKITFRPPVMPEDEKETIELIKVFFSSKNITVSYGVMMEIESGKALYTKIDFSIPDSAFKTTPAFTGTYGL